MSGAFVYDNPDVMQDYTYMADHMGNIAALVDSTPSSPTHGTARRQVFDAFGNNIGGYLTFRCASDRDFTDDPWFDRFLGTPPEPPCPLPEEQWPQPVERMQTGGFNWRGGEGSITDRAAEDMPDTEENTLRWSAYTRPSTGLIYMQARYYEPETGRFTQADPMPYGLETFAYGQNNRWTYCANDPVNCSDPTGEWIVVVLIILALILFAIGFNLGVSTSCYANRWSSSTLTGIFGTLAGLAIAKALAAGSLYSIGAALAAVGFFPVVAILLACFFIGFLMGAFVAFVYDAIYESIVAQAETIESTTDEYIMETHYCLVPIPLMIRQYTAFV